MNISSETNNSLDIQKVLATITKLNARIEDRLPNSSLLYTCRDFHFTALKCHNVLTEILKPNYFLRFICGLVIVISLLGAFYGCTLIELEVQNTIFDIATFAEASINNILLIGAAYYFIFNLEKRFERAKAIKYMNILSGYVHVVDMHQLTKDPHVYCSAYESSTEHSPERILTPFEFQRYLIYCTEFLSLISKVSAIFSHSIEDNLVAKNADEIENLSSLISSKIWQKLIILERITISG